MAGIEEHTTLKTYTLERLDELSENCDDLFRMVKKLRANLLSVYYGERSGEDALRLINEAAILINKIEDKYYWEEKNYYQLNKEKDNAKT